MNEYTFEKLSFWQLLDSRKVEIPIIQRDYAQGRVKKEKIRNNFLEAIKRALLYTPIELDFVYGSEIKKVLQPLDGQQRLTTLFLLHWFIATKEGVLDEAKERLLKFTYETRTSSHEFCIELINKSIDYNNLLPINEKLGVTKENQLSATIKNAAWFVISWENDPTISSMLIMIDAIHAKFQDSSDFWTKLTNEVTRPITFLYIKLENFGLSDDLYIKMNARGKALTPFENFKSRLEKHIKDNAWEKDSINPQEMFAHKIDTTWTDLFWKYRKEIKRISDTGEETIEYKIDDSLTNFITGIAICFYAQNLEIIADKDKEEKVRNELSEKSKSKNISENVIKRERIERRITTLFNNANEINATDFPNKESFDYLVDCLNLYTQKNFSDLKANIDLWKYCENTLFQDLINNDKSEWQNRVVFYAQTAYLLNGEFNENTYNDWMRVVRNIVENSTIDSAATFISAINLVHEISIGSSNIYKYLSENGVNAGHAQKQVKEEIQKAKIIVSYPDAKQIIQDTEDTNFCKGQIDFALYCIDYDIDNEPLVSTFDNNKFHDVFNTIISHFNNLETVLPDDFKRAFLTIGNNDYYEVWGSWSHSFDSHKRWLLGKYNDLKGFSLDKNWKRDYLKELLIQLVQKGSLKNIINDYNFPSNIPNWKIRLIKEEKLLKGATFILIPNNNSYCKLAWQQRPSKEDQVKKVK